MANLANLPNLAGKLGKFAKLPAQFEFRKTQIATSDDSTLDIRQASATCTNWSDQRKPVCWCVSFKYERKRV